MISILNRQNSISASVSEIENIIAAPAIAVVAEPAASEDPDKSWAFKFFKSFEGSIEKIEPFLLFIFYR